MSKSFQNFRSWRIQACVLSLSLLIAACCCMRWSETDDFVSGLRCGMTADEVKQYASGFRGTKTFEPSSSDLPDFVVEHDDTDIRLWFANDRLEKVQVAWISRPMKFTEEKVIHLCR